MRIDHVVYAAADIDAAAARLAAEHGLEVTGGGRHEEHGTHNRILPLGGGYMEVVGIADVGEAQGSPFGRGVLEYLRSQGDGWLTWVVAVPDVDAVAGRLGTPITVLRRAGLSVRLTGVAEAVQERFLPFFLTRDPGVADPGQGGAAGGIAELELAGDAGRLKRWLDGGQLPLRLVDGPGALRAVRVGDRELR